MLELSSSSISIHSKTEIYFSLSSFVGNNLYLLSQSFPEFIKYHSISLHVFSSLFSLETCANALNNNEDVVILCCPSIIDACKTPQKFTSSSDIYKIPPIKWFVYLSSLPTLNISSHSC
jgi:hypothetical protein